MSFYKSYLEEIKERKAMGLNPKPIDNETLTDEIVSQIKDDKNKYRTDSLNFFIYNILPGTTGAASVKAQFLKNIILGNDIINEISPEFALELLAHMKGGPSIKVLLDIALDNDVPYSQQAGEVLKTQVFLYESDTNRLKKSYKSGNTIAKEILKSYSKAEFFTKLPDIDKKIKVVTYIACLLYTSPSPRDGLLSRMPSSA